MSFVSVMLQTLARVPVPYTSTDVGGAVTAAVHYAWTRMDPRERPMYKHELQPFFARHYSSYAAAYERLKLHSTAARAAAADVPGVASAVWADASKHIGGMRSDWQRRVATPPCRLPSATDCQS